MSEPDRDEQGRFSSEVDADAVFEWMDPGERYRSGEIADALDVPKRTVKHYLDELEEEGRVEHHEIHSRLFQYERVAE